MEHLRIFIWNDKPVPALDWEALVVQEIGCPVEKCSEIDIDAVVKKLVAFSADVIILDIMTPGDEQTGIAIALAIRKMDALVPIIAVTDDLKVVYAAAARGLDTVGFAGVYSARVMAPALFRKAALRPALNLWHRLAPEFVLVRTCTRLLKQVLGSADAQLVHALTAVLEALPFSGLVDSWHEQICKPLHKIMRHRAKHVAERFLELTEIFRKADAFYMAGSSARRHVSHNVQVFLVGLCILLQCDPIRAAAVQSVRQARGDELWDETKALMDAVLLWACVAMTHDCAYLSQHLESVLQSVRNVQKFFVQVLVDERAKITTRSKYKWPSVPHGEVAARLWTRPLPDGNTGYEVEYCKLIAQAIERHDTEATRAGGKAPIEKWAMFLAVLADELQDWGRERTTSVPSSSRRDGAKWQLFVLERLSCARNTIEANPQWILTLSFVAEDFPSIVGKKGGRAGDDVIDEMLAHTCKMLGDNLDAKLSMEVYIEVLVPTRNDTPFFDSVRI